MVDEDRVRTTALSIEGPLHFIGKPGACRTRVLLRNHSDEKLNVKRIHLAASRDAGARSVPFGTIHVSCRLPPGGASQVLLQLDVPAHASPGRHVAEAAIGSRILPVTVDILESWDLAIVPGHLSLKVPGGARITRTIQLANLGNMPSELRRAVHAPLTERDGAHRNVFLAIKEAGDKGHEGVLDAFVERMRETEVEPATIRLRDQDPLSPGETRDVEIEIALPQRLKTRRIYEGVAWFENARLDLDIEVVEGSQPSRQEKR